MYEKIPAAVAAGNDKNVYMVGQKGYVYEFNEEGEILFIFGGPDDGSQRVGLCANVAAIGVDKADRIYILDSDKAQIQVYVPTEFTKLLHEALRLYADGRYTESKEPLAKVLEMNSLFDYANKAMGRAYFQEENYEMAKYYAKLAKDNEGYSDASWEIRNIWLKSYIMPAIFLIVVLWLVSVAVKKLDRKRNLLMPVRAFKEKCNEKRFVRNVRFAWYFMRHPIDGSYYIAREDKANLSAANFLLIVFMAEFVVNKYLAGFLWKRVREGEYNIMSDIGTILILVIGLALCTYLITTINDGEGTVKKIYCTYVFSLTPFITFIPLEFILSHVLTDNESFIISMLYILVYAWCGTLLILGIKEVNNYNAKETAKVAGLTLFAALILTLLIFIIYVLGSQVIEFIAAIIGEVVYRIGG